MLVQILCLLAGLALVVYGANILVDGASSVARRSGLSEFIIGLTIVGMGTSAPEMVVSFIGAIEGKPDIAIGNVVGSNIFNTLLILGLTAFILPVDISRANRTRDIPMNIGISLLLLVLGLESTLLGIGTDGLSRVDGGILTALFLIYMGFCLKHDDKSVQENKEGKEQKLWLSLLMIAGGLAGLIFGGRIFVNSATAIAQEIGVSDKFIAITILAGGTSMPELATCIVAAAKKKGQLALGNIIGSNIFNVLLILGGSALIHPLSFSGMTCVDLGVFLVSAIALATSVAVGKKNQIDRVDGVLFVLVWAAYMAYLIVKL